MSDDPSDLQRLSRQRKREAAVLLRAGLYPGAYYLVGYAVECALKACIAKQRAKYEFPDKHLANDAWTHDLARLVDTARISGELADDIRTSPQLESHWVALVGWSEASRYDLAITKAQARALYSACTRRHTGVLPWVCKRW